MMVVILFLIGNNYYDLYQTLSKLSDSAPSYSMPPSCSEKDYTGTKEGKNNLIVGSGSDYGNGSCNLLIGSYLIVPAAHPDYFENIGNRLCRDIRTDQSLDCKTGLPISFQKDAL